MNTISPNNIISISPLPIIRPLQRRRPISINFRRYRQQRTITYMMHNRRTMMSRSPNRAAMPSKTPTKTPSRSHAPRKSTSLKSHNHLNYRQKTKDILLININLIIIKIHYHNPSPYCRKSCLINTRKTIL